MDQCTEQTYNYWFLIVPCFHPTLLQRSEVEQIDDNFWEVPKESVQLVTMIANGTYGAVWRAKAWDISGKDGMTVVAVKELNSKSLTTYMLDVKFAQDS